MPGSMVTAVNSTGSPYLYRAYNPAGKTDTEYLITSVINAASENRGCLRAITR